MAQTVQQVLENAVFYSDNEPYIFLRLPPAAVTAAAGVIAEIGEPFCGILVDKDEITLMIPQPAWDDFQQRLPGAVVGDDLYRLITLDVVLEPDLTGLIAQIGQALASAGISILPFAAFSRDHIFVRESQFDQAMATLNHLKTQ